MKKFEYRIISLDENQLNNAAREGFRYVDVFKFRQWDYSLNRHIEYDMAIMEREIQP